MKEYQEKSVTTKETVSESAEDKTIATNKMATKPIRSLFWRLGLPMMLSMVLQALYNVVDSAFVTNMKDSGALANEALTIAFPVQIMIIAIGVGTGIGLNALLSRSLGKNDKETVNTVAGNGIFLALVIYAVFLLFGLFLSKWFIGLFTDNEQVLKMGTDYLKICTCLSLGSIGYTVYERFLQATGKTAMSTIAQISGAVTNIVLDYVFIFPLGMGVSGAAWATVIGQFVSLFVAMAFHYFANKEIGNGFKYLLPKAKIIKDIYKIGFSATIMQALLSVMMACMNAILGKANVDSTQLVGAFGIYYKIQQIALFSAFGLSNTIITLLSFNYGLGDKQRCKNCIKTGTVGTVAVMLCITAIFEIIAKPLAELFALSGGNSVALVDICTLSVRIGSIGFVFMGLSVAVQGVLQALGKPWHALLTAFLRLVVFILPTAYIFTLSNDVLNLVWWSFPISELLTATVSVFFLISSLRIIEKIEAKIPESVSDSE